jgi:hypothetical protein
VTHTAAEPRFVARPFVCGALGPRDPHVLERLRDAVPGLVAVHETPDVLLLADRALEPYRRDADVRAWAFGDHTPRADADWRTAALDAEAPGLADLGDRVVLHAGAHGLLDVFHRLVDQTTWFSARLEPLLRLVAEPLDIDWEDWACQFVMQLPVGDRTPVRQVRRLDGAHALVADRSSGRARTERWSPPWIGLPEPTRGADAVPDVLDALRAAIVREVKGPVTLPLSGGHDSRLLGILLRDAGAQATTWTTTKDDGHDEIGIVRELAPLLGFPSRYLEPTPVGYGPRADATLARLGHMVSMHVWAGALGEVLRAEGRPVVAGDGMDITLANNHIPEAAARARDRATWQAAILDDVAKVRSIRQVLAPPAMAWAVEVARDAWRAAVRHLEGDANEVTLSVLTTRTVHGPGALPLWLFGPEVAVVVPGLDKDVLRAALAVRLTDKVGGAFHRQLLAGADPAIAAVRSTHDEAEQSRPGHRARTSEEARRWLLSHVRTTEPIRDLVNPRLPLILDAGDHRAGQPADPDAAPDPYGEPVNRRLELIVHRTLGLAAFGAWLERYGDLVRSTDPPWPTTRPWHPARVRSFARRLRRRAVAPVDRNA